jgi:hypothetical protein
MIRTHITIKKRKKNDLEHNKVRDGLPDFPLATYSTGTATFRTFIPEFPTTL